MWHNDSAKQTKKPEKFWLKASLPDFILLC
jgi:hypothetical protein